MTTQSTALLAASRTAEEYLGPNVARITPAMEHQAALATTRLERIEAMHGHRGRLSVADIALKEYPHG